jgi:hypothetical protein
LSWCVYNKIHMADIERKGGGSLPDSFRTMMEHAGLQSMEQSGFNGQMSVQLNKWHRRELGLAIGFPSFNNQFRGIMYALPLNDFETPNIDERVLLITPSETACHFAIIGPRESKAITAKLAEQENNNSARDFHAIFSPSKEPFILYNWIPQSDYDPFNEFIADPNLLSKSVSVKVVLSKKNADLFLQEAVTVAVKKAERKRVRDLKVNEESLQETVGQAVSEDLGLLNEIFSRETARRTDQANEGSRLLRSLETEITTQQSVDDREAVADIEIAMLRDILNQPPDDDNA